MLDVKCELDDMGYIQTSYTDEEFDYDPESVFNRQLEILDHQIETITTDPSTAKVGQGPDVYIGFDSEFLSGKKGSDNTVLSLQFYLIGECGVLPKIIYPTGDKRSDRPSFYKTISGLIIEALEKRVILEWPRRVIVCGFFLRLDLPAFGDLVSFKTKLDSAGGRISSIESHIDVEPDPSDIERLLHNKSYVTSADDGFKRLLQVRFVDVGSHVAVGTSIKQMGDLIGLPKLEIPEGYSIERMDLLLLGNKQAFEDYGLRDAEIAVRYYQKLQNFAEKHTASRNLPVTASGLAVKMFTKQLEANGVDFNSAFGTKSQSSTRWDNKKGRVVTFKNKTATEMRSRV